MTDKQRMVAPPRHEAFKERAAGKTAPLRRVNAEDRSRREMVWRLQPMLEIALRVCRRYAEQQQENEGDDKA